MEVEQLIGAAQQLTGLPDLGDESILEALNGLVDATNDEAELNERGEKSVEGILAGALANRLRVEGYLSKHPELLERTVEKPMFVFGMPLTAEAAMRAHLADNPKGKYGRHVYALEGYGLTAEAVRALYNDYCERFNIPLQEPAA